MNESIRISVKDQWHSIAKNLRRKQKIKTNESVTQTSNHKKENRIAASRFAQLPFDSRSNNDPQCFSLIATHVDRIG